MLAVEDLLVKYADAPFVVLSDFDGTCVSPPSLALSPSRLRARRERGSCGLTSTTSLPPRPPLAGTGSPRRTRTVCPLPLVLLLPAFSQPRLTPSSPRRPRRPSPPPPPPPSPPSLTLRRRPPAQIDLYGMGPVARRALWSKVVTGEDGANFRDAFRTSLESVRDALAFDECVDILRKGASPVPSLSCHPCSLGSSTQSVLTGLLPRRPNPPSDQARPGLRRLLAVVPGPEPARAAHPRLERDGAHHPGHPGRAPRRVSPAFALLFPATVQSSACRLCRRLTGARRRR